MRRNVQTAFLSIPTCLFPHPPHPTHSTHTKRRFSISKNASYFTPTYAITPNQRPFMSRPYLPTPTHLPRTHAHTQRAAGGRGDVRRAGWEEWMSPLLTAPGHPPGTATDTGTLICNLQVWVRWVCSVAWVCTAAHPHARRTVYHCDHGKPHHIPKAPTPPANESVPT